MKDTFMMKYGYRLLGNTLQDAFEILSKEIASAAAAASYGKKCATYKSHEEMP